MTRKERIEWRLGSTILYQQLLKDNKVVAKILEKAKARLVETNESCGFTILYKEWKHKKGEN